MKCIDVHAHYCPPEFYKRLESRKSLPYVRAKENGAWLYRYGKDQSSSVRARMYSLDHRLDEMDTLGIQTQVLSPLLHGIHKLSPETGLDLCRLVNDGVAEVVQKYKGRFEAFGVLPLQGIPQSLQELERIVHSMHFRGVVALSNVDGHFLDEAVFWPVYERVAGLDVPIFLHPTHPVNDKGMKDHGLVSCLGFLYDTTLAMSRIIFSGLLERFANLKFILPHVGSLIPFITARMDKELTRSAKTAELKRAPSNYFKLVYVDTVSLHEPALMLAHRCLGPDRILFGCDYPFWGLEEGYHSVEKLTIPNPDKESIFHGNAERLLKIAP